MKIPLILKCKRLLAVLLCTVSINAWSELDNYVIDIKGQHAFIQFKIKHLGYSWLLGEFRKFDGQFSYDANNISASKLMVEIDVNSLDSNHAERDKHLKGEHFLAVNDYPKAGFRSEKIVAVNKDAFDIYGELNLRGVKKSIVINANKIGEGPDPWLGYRAGFEGKTSLTLTDFNITRDLGPASTQVELLLYVEGVRQPKNDDEFDSEFFQ